MRKRKALAAVWSSICLCIFSGCGESAQSLTTGTEDTPEHISQELCAYITVDADVTVEQPEQLYTYTALYDVLDAERLKEIFMPDEADAVMDAMPEFENYTCMTADGTKRASMAAGIIYTDKPYSYYYVLVVTGDNWRLFPESFPDIETVEALPFADGKEAKDAARQMAGRLDLTLDEEPFVFEGIDAAGLTELYEQGLEIYGEDGIRRYLPDFEIEPDMGCYYMVWRVLGPHSERLRNANLHIGGGTWTDGEYVAAIYSPGGLTYFYTNAVFEYESEEPLDQIVSVEAALEQIKGLYENVIMTEEDQITITEIALEYVPQLVNIDGAVYEIKPAWCMYGTTGTTDSPFMLMVDAQTGEVL